MSLVPGSCVSQVWLAPSAPWGSLRHIRTGSMPAHPLWLAYLDNVSGDPVSDNTHSWLGVRS